MTPLYHPRPERWPQFTLKGLLMWMALVGTALSWVEQARRFAQGRNSVVWGSNPVLDGSRFAFSGKVLATWQAYFFDDYEITEFLFGDQEISPDIRTEIHRLYPAATIKVGQDRSPGWSTLQIP